MKKIILFFCLSLIIASCKKEKTIDSKPENTKDISEWSNFGLNGKVKSTSEYTTETQQKEQTGARKFESLFNPDTNYTFDDFGKLIQKTILDENGSVTEEIIYEGKDKILSSKTYISPTQFSSIKYTWENDINTIITRKNPDGSQLEKEVFQYDKGVKVNRLKFNLRDIQTDRIAYVYDANNRLIEEKHFRDKPTIQSSLAITYDENGNKSSEASYDKDYKLIWKTSFTYNNNLLINSKTFDTSNKLAYELFNEYDDQNRLITKGTFDAFDNSNNKEVFQYDTSNNKTSWTIYKNEKIVSITEYSYDDENNLVAEIIYDSSRKILFTKKIEYSYDDKSNWINRKTTINDSETFFTSRKIEYYN